MAIDKILNYGSDFMCIEEEKTKPFIDFCR